jgi:hypothetical protein
MSRIIRPVLAILIGAAALTGASAFADQRRGLGEVQPGANGRKARTVDAPPQPGALNGAAAVAAVHGPLEPLVIARGGNPEDYAAVLASDESLWITAEGELMFIDAVHHDVDAEGNPIPAEPATPTGPPPTPIALLANGMPIHHSKAGAPWTIYLDFDGELVRSFSWGIFNRFTGGLTLDADASTFNPDEQAVISRMWGRVAEDWAPFDVDVTTERPAVIGATVLWSIIGKRPGDLGFPSNVGGVSQFNFGYVPFGLDHPTFTFWQPFGAADHSTLADVITQENGHMFGLLHDSVMTDFGFVNEYYGGHGTGPTSWGPVMGAPIERNVTQWSKVEYPRGLNFLSGFGALPPQDDIAIIAGKLGFRADDFADTTGGAQPLVAPRSGFITSTADVDVFSLPLASDVHIEITPFRAGDLTDGGNLDVAAEILNASGTVVAAADDLEQTAATLTAELPLTPHFLRVRPSSNPANYSTYASLGAYTVTGTFVRVVKIVGFQEPLPSATVTHGRTLPVKFTLTDTVAAARVLLLPAEDASPADALAETACQAQPQGRQHCNLRIPSSTVPGTTCWIVAQYQDTDGRWAALRPATPAATINPTPITVE